MGLCAQCTIPCDALGVCVQISTVWSAQRETLYDLMSQESLYLSKSGICAISPALFHTALITPQVHRGASFIAGEQWRIASPGEFQCRLTIPQRRSKIPLDWQQIPNACTTSTSTDTSNASNASSARSRCRRASHVPVTRMCGVRMASVLQERLECLHLF